MLLIVFGLLLALTLIFLFAGQYMDAPFLKISGSVFMFIMGMVLLFGAVSYQSGSTEVTQYSYVGENLSLTNTTTNYIYSDWGTDVVNGLDINHVFGFLLCVVGVFLFIFAFIEIKPPGELDWCVLKFGMMTDH